MALLIAAIGAQAAGGARTLNRASGTKTNTTLINPSSIGNLTPANQPALDQAADDAQSIAGTAYYTNARVDAADNTVDVYLANAPQSIIDQLNAKHPGIYVINNNAAHPLSQLLQVEHSLPQRIDGITIAIAYPTSDGYLKVGVEGTDVQTAQAALDSSAGAGTIQVFGGAEPVQLAGYRYNEGSPYNGGDFIHHSADNCSSGINVHKTGSPMTTYMLTAAHCFWADGGVGTTVHQGYDQCCGAGNYGSNTLLGSVSKSDNDGPGQTTNDAALISTLTGYDVFKSGWNSTEVTAVASTTENHGGDTNVCTSGAFDGTDCNLTIQNLNVMTTGCISSGDCITVFAVSAKDTSNSNDVAAGEGDSGGPVYSFDGSGNAVARGMIDSAGTDSRACTSTPPNTAGRICAHTVYFVGMATITGDLGVSTTTN